MTSTMTKSWTITEAHHVASKIAADLDLLRARFGNPTESNVEAYADEAALLLAKRFLKTVEYGFKLDGKVILAIKYEAHNDGTLSIDDRPGRIPRGEVPSSAYFYSYLTYTSAFHNDLSDDEQDVFKSQLPIQRTTSGNPETAYGYWRDNKTYSKSGEGVKRKEFIAS